MSGNPSKELKLYIKYDRKAVAAKYSNKKIKSFIYSKISKHYEKKWEKLVTQG